ncbi:hypothetical protein BDZ89DRAFT_121625 [Hymenopellis radicata]|nr:hypothetical protein BDZ89DRAFT_121625 [Hymenopellis radicata]
MIPKRGPMESQADLEQGFVGPWLGGGVVAKSSRPYSIPSITGLSPTVIRYAQSIACRADIHSPVPRPSLCRRQLPRRPHVHVGFCLGAALPDRSFPFSHHHPFHTSAATR